MYFVQALRHAPKGMLRHGSITLHPSLQPQIHFIKLRAHLLIHLLAEGFSKKPFPVFPLHEQAAAIGILHQVEIVFCLEKDWYTATPFEGFVYFQGQDFGSEFPLSFHGINSHEVQELPLLKLAIYRFQVGMPIRVCVKIHEFIPHLLSRCLDQDGSLNS